jgi:hypothetical protein
VIDLSSPAPGFPTAERKALQREIESLRGRIVTHAGRSGETDAQLRESIVRFGHEVVRLFANEKG